MPINYRCDSCGYTGPIVLELEKEETGEEKGRS
jgi:phage-related protein